MSSVPQIEIGEGRGRNGGYKKEEHKPALWSWERLRFEWASRFEDVGGDCFCEAQVWAAIEIVLKHGVNLFGRYPFLYH